MERTKAQFRAVREMVGLSQGDLAQLLGVNVVSVKRWEHPDKPWEPPADAWELLEEAWELQSEVVSNALDIVDETAEEYGDPEVVRLSYWRSAEQFAKRYTHEKWGSCAWKMANANSRAVAAAARSYALEVSFVDGSAKPEE